ncbi:allatotropin-like [Hermetia illucens]|nr:allatotropin-like [Hermetia illucens]
MHLHHVAVTFLAILTLNLPLGKCGPARSIALVAQRSPKIPISIRAPFKHSETMVARGYGKRAFSIGDSQFARGYGKRGGSDEVRFPFNGQSQSQFARGFGKRLSLSHPEATEYQNYGSKAMSFLDEEANNNSEVTNETSEQVSNESSQVDGVPVEWVAKELADNRGLLKAILYRFVDTNKDGFLTSQEFLGTSNNDGNNNSY